MLHYCAHEPQLQRSMPIGQTRCATSLFTMVSAQFFVETKTAFGSGYHSAVSITDWRCALRVTSNRSAYMAKSQHSVLLCHHEIYRHQWSVETDRHAPCQPELCRDRRAERWRRLVRLGQHFPLSRVERLTGCTQGRFKTMARNAIRYSLYVNARPQRCADKMTVYHRQRRRLY